MKIPKTLKIGAMKYDILYPYDFSGNVNDYVGMHYGGISAIQVKKTDPSHSCETLLHETLHAVDFMFTNNILEEDIIATVSVALFNLLADNDFTVTPTVVKIGAFNFKVDTETKLADPEYMSYWHSQSDKMQICPSIDGEPVTPLFLKYMVFANSMLIIYDLYKIKFPKFPEPNEDFVEKSFTHGVFVVLEENKLFSFFNKVLK